MTGETASDYPWPTVPAGELLSRRYEPVELQPDRYYKLVTIRVNNRGVTVRKEVPGAELGTARWAVRTGQLILSGIDARHGAVGLVPPEVNGGVITNDFWSLDIDSRLDPRFLAYFVATGAFRKACVRASEGTTNRVRLKPDAFERIPLPVPRLAEQHRLVAKLDALWSRLAEAEAGITERHASLARAVDQLVVGPPDHPHPRIPMSAVVEIDTRTVEVQRGQTYHFAGIKSFGKGMFDAGKKVAGEHFKYDVLVPLREGHLVYPKLMAWEGALAVVPAEFDGRFVSPEFVQFRPTGVIAPEVLDAWFRSPRSLPDLRGGSTGTNVRRNRLMPTTFMRVTMPRPDAGPQRAVQRIAALQRQMRDHSVHADDIETLRSTILDRAFSGRL